MRFKLAEEKWQQRLSEQVFAITRHADTERPFSGEYNQLQGEGRYHCICCFAPLFGAEHQYISGCGWPSFDTAITQYVGQREDSSLARLRMEIFCNACDSHIGHVFPDGPSTTTGMRHCVNSLSVKFRPQQQEIEALIEVLATDKWNKVEFAAVLALIDSYFNFTPTAFSNGAQHNQADENNGSCKVFTFAHQYGLSKTQTLHCFAEHYQSVLADPQGEDHQNIRQFMQHGWDGVCFSDIALELKKES